MVTSRRERRREETISEILRISVDLMAALGVAALNLSDVARQLGIQPPSLFKYFPNKIALYDALFADGARQVLTSFESAAAATKPGVPALRAGVEAIGRWSLANQPVAQLLFWRTVPGFEPTAQASQPLVDLVAAISRVLQDAVDQGQLRADATDERAQALLSTLIAGAMTQQIANEPGADFDAGRYTGLLPQLIDMFVEAHQ